MTSAQDRRQVLTALPDSLAIAAEQTARTWTSVRTRDTSQSVEGALTLMVSPATMRAYLADWARQDWTAMRQLWKSRGAGSRNLRTR